MAVYEERVVEVQAQAPGKAGAGSAFSERFLTAEDGPPYFDARTGRALNSLDDVRLPIGYAWTGNWRVVLDQRGADDEGWVPDGRLRRRWWTRKREKLAVAAAGVAASPPVPSLLSAAAAATPSMPAAPPAALRSSAPPPAVPPLLTTMPEAAMPPAPMPPPSAYAAAAAGATQAAAAPFAAPGTSPALPTLRTASSSELERRAPAPGAAQAAQGLAPPKARLSAASPPDEMLRAATGALQALSDAASLLTTASAPDVVAAQTERGRGALRDAQQALALLEQAKALAAQRIKLGNDVSRASQRFSAAANDAAARVKARPGGASVGLLVRGGTGPGAGAGAGAGASPGAASLLAPHSAEIEAAAQQSRAGAGDEAAGELRMAQLVSEAGLNEELILQRNEELREINSMAVKVHGMMKELGAMVEEQDHGIKVVTKNVSAAKDNVDAGLRQVQKAEQYQTEGGNCVLS